MVYTIIITGDISKTIHTTSPYITLNELSTDTNSYYFISRCKPISRTLELVSPTTFVEAHYRLLGGKGGFGSLLRGQQTRAGQKRTTDFSACRDLNGRRIRHVKNEKELKEWYEKERKRKEEEARKKSEEKDRIAMETTQKVLNEMNEMMKEQEKSIRTAVQNALKNNKRVRQEDDEQDQKKKKKGKFLAFQTEFDEDTSSSEGESSDEE